MKKKSIIAIAGSIVLLLLIGVNLQKTYEEKIIEYSKLVFPTGQDSYAQIVPTKKYLKKNGEESNLIHLSLKPGEKYSDDVLIKNTPDGTKKIIFESRDIQEYDNDYKAKLNEEDFFTFISIDEPIKTLRADEAKYFDFTVEIPSDTPTNTYYRGVLQSKFVKDQNLKNDDPDVIKFATEVALGTTIYIEVTDNPYKFESETELDNPNRLAMNHVIHKIRWIIAILLGSFSLLFLIKYLRIKK